MKVNLMTKKDYWRQFAVLGTIFYVTFYGIPIYSEYLFLFNRCCHKIYISILWTRCITRQCVKKKKILIYFLGRIIPIQTLNHKCELLSEYNVLKVLCLSHISIETISTSEQLQRKFSQWKIWYYDIKFSTHFIFKY